MLEGYLSLDIETTTTEYLGRTASPFTSDNWTVAAGWAYGSEQPQGEYYGADKTGSRGLFKRLLEQYRPKYIAGFNIKFDILHLLRYEEDFEAWMDWIVAGGQLWDGQLAEYLLDGQDQASHYLSLDEVAPRYGGTLKIDEVKAMWAAGINTHEIPKQLLMDYLLGRDDDDGDIGNTRKVFLGQTKVAKKRGQVSSIQLNNGALVATIEMERNGNFVNVELGLAKAKQLAEEIAVLKEELHGYLPDDLPFEFKWSSPKQRSALIFGGVVKYEERVPVLDNDGQQAYAQMEVVEETGEFYKSGLRAGQAKTRKVKVNDPSKPKSRMEEFHYTLPGFTKPKPEWASAEPGYYSTKAEIIEELGGRGIPFLDKFADLGDKVKDLGTYYIQEEYDGEGNVTKRKGMLSLVHGDGLVHQSIGMTGTKTGRFNHSNPNTGNLPRADTSDVKQMFESRFGAHGFIVQSDFRSLEIYMQALLSGDKQLIKDLQNDLDMHVKRLTQVYKLPYEELHRMAVVEKVPLWKNRRTNIKVFSFQRAYGAGPPKIARFLKVPIEDVEQWVEADEALYPGITEYQDRVKAAVQQSRVPTSQFIRHPTAGVQLQLGVGKYKTFDGKRYTFYEGPSPAFLVRKGIYQGFMPTEIKNYPVQGLGGEWMKAAMWLMVRALYKYRRFGGMALLVNTVHDAMYLDVHESVRRKAGVLLHAAMLAASELMGYLFDKDIVVPVPSETHWGPSMFVEHEFEDPKGFAEAAQSVREWMARTYMI